MSDQSSCGARPTLAPPRDGGTPHLAQGLATLRERLRWADGLLLCLDFDGTLAPIVDDPDQAEARSASLTALEALRECSQVTVTIISGRAIDDVRPRVGLEGIRYSGNHGFVVERDGEHHVAPAATQARTALERVLEEISEALDPVPGVIVEDKDVTATVHYRNAPPDCHEEVRIAVEGAVDDRPDLRVTEGKASFELRPDANADKGRAVELFRDNHDGYLPMYVGDDETDESAFRAVLPEGIGVHVGTRSDTAAKYRVDDPAAVTAMLRWLADEGTDHLTQQARAA